MQVVNSDYQPLSLDTQSNHSLANIANITCEYPAPQGWSV